MKGASQKVHQQPRPHRHARVHDDAEALRAADDALLAAFHETEETLAKDGPPVKQSLWRRPPPARGGHAGHDPARRRVRGAGDAVAARAARGPAPRDQSAPMPPSRRATRHWSTPVRPRRRSRPRGPSWSTASPRWCRSSSRAGRSTRRRSTGSRRASSTTPRGSRRRPRTGPTSSTMPARPSTVRWSPCRRT